jgi:hypothetical protein
MSDNYEYKKSSRPQDIDDYSPYMDKQYNGYINDLNSGVYTNTSLSLVQFDLGQIYNSQKFTDTNDLFLVLPITMVAAFSTGSVAVAPTAGNSQLLAMKTNFINLIHQADLQINGKTIESTQSFVNVAKNFQMLSEMSVNDLATIGYTLGFGDSVDNPRSAVWNGNSAAANGQGFTNNKIAGARYPTTIQLKPNDGTGNDAITSKLNRYVDTASSYNGIHANILSTTNLTNEGKPIYQVLNTNYMTWYDTAVIKLSNLFESLGNVGLVRKFDCTIRLWVNTGSVNVAVTNPNATNLTYSLATANNTFTNTCPFTLNYLNVATTAGIPATTTNIVAGLYINKPPTTSAAAINLSTSGAAHPISACRIYFSQIQIEPTKALTYVEQNRNKKVVYRTLLTNQYNNTTAGGNFNQLINSGVIHPTGILIVPFISSQQAGLGDFAWKSPFDTAPTTGHPISLTNLQVSVGGVNQLQSTLYYSYENFIEQINLAEALTSSDFGITCGLMNQSYWETFRSYYVNIERSAITDKNVPRNINVSFTNNTQVAIDVLTFIFYSDEFVIDVESGLVKK